MSILDRLRVQGVRSFGIKEEDKAEIIFKCPLTLILGHNGCGKTTIIESLKYATSGDQPPNAKSIGGGSGFVHDPKMLSANEVLAQVKLRIRDINGRRSTVSRSMKNIQKLKKVEFKTLDSTISWENKNGQVETISSRCADIDKEMCDLLGVSKSILNYVIFCHQEESCWPMEEGKKVKERFDEIFDSAKYNKCLEHIRKLKKQRSTGVLVLKKEVESLLVYKNEADEKKKKLLEEEARLTATDEVISNYDRDISTVDVKLDAVKEKDINIASLTAEKSVNGIKLDELRKTIQEIRAGLRDKEFSGTDEELEKEITSFNADLSEKKNKLDSIEENLNKLVVAEKHLRLKLSKEENELGGLKRDFLANKEFVQTRNEFINKLAADLKLAEMVSPYNESQVDTVKQNVERKLREMKSNINSLKVDNDNEEKRLQTVIDEIREERAKLEQIKKAKSDQLNKTKLEIGKVRCDINEVAESTKNLSILDNKLKRLEKDLEEHQKSLNVDEIGNEIKQLQKNRDRMDDELIEINKEMDKLIDISQIQSSLNSCLDRKVSCEEEINRLRLKNEDTLRHLLNQVPEQNVSQRLDSCLTELADRIRLLQKDINDKRQELTKFEMEQRHLEEKLRTSNQILSDDLEQIQRICGADDYEQVLSDVTQKLKVKQSETGKLSASDHFYREYIKKLQQPKPCCPLCKRDFEEEDNAIRLAQELESKLKNIPAALSSLTEDQEKLNHKLNNLQQLKPVNDRVASLKHSEIPIISKKLTDTKENVTRIRDQLVNMESELMAGPQADEQMAKSIQSDSITIDQKQSELDGLSREIEEYQSKIPASGRTLQQVQNDRDQLQLELENTRKKIDSHQSRKVVYNDRLNNLQNDKHNIVKEQLRIQTGKQKEQQLLDKEKDLKDLKAVLESEIDSATNDVLPMQQKLEQAVRNKEEVRKTNSNALLNETDRLNGVERKLEEVEKLQIKITEFARRGIESKLENTEQNISQIKRDIDGFDQKKSLLQANKDTIKTDISNQDTRQRDLLDNRKLRAKRHEELSLQLTIKEMEDKLGVLDYSLIKKQRQSLEEQINTMTGKKNIAEGRRKELAISTLNLRQEMEKSIYKNALKNYQEKIIDLTLEEAVNKDLDSYYIALDWALKHFHHERMTEINSIVKDLWHKIYRGHDIDHIEIKCDIETSTSADKKRVYNYKVVQVKNGIELDMRGRCSAGQKMLASIIIRMALAETFSNNCRIMTLDEPTTNLDRANIESLSQALAEIVRDRTKHKKFQLVIITHDEDFLMRLTTIDKVDHFWKVYKDDFGLSKVIDCEV